VKLRGAAASLAELVRRLCFRDRRGHRSERSWSTGIELGFADRRAVGVS
jgi:hypothetical protein